MKNTRGVRSQNGDENGKDTKMKIYLAGKIEKNCWRHSIVDSLRGGTLADGNAPWHSRNMERSIFGIHDYTGPFFVGCDHGCYHGYNSHGVGVVSSGCESTPAPTKQETVDRCLRAIRASQLVFVWIDALDCYGTLCEMGFAFHKRFDEHHYQEVVVAHPPDFDVSELWFPLTAADAVVVADSPRAALRNWLIDNGHLTPESYICFIEAIGLDRIKIGMAKDPDSQLAALQAGSPVPLRLLGETLGGVSLERKLHSEFSDSHIDRGWFHANGTIRSYIGRLTHAG